MSKKHRKFSSEFKAKVVLELLEGDKSVSEIASKYGILPKSIHQWKKQFLENASLAFENTIPAKKYKEEIKEKESQIEALSKALGQATFKEGLGIKKINTGFPQKCIFVGCEQLGLEDQEKPGGAQAQKPFNHQADRAFGDEQVYTVL